MNSLEQRMVSVLKLLRDDFGVVSVKAEFEAEGTRTEELMRLKEVAIAAGLKLTLKIGGPEAVRDMYDARSIGVDHLVAPMVESAYALKKYIRAIQNVFPKDEQEDIEFLVNIETVQTVARLDGIFESPEFADLDGVVVGRGDLVESMERPRDSVDDDVCFKLVSDILVRAKNYGKATVMGGSITAKSLPFLGRLPKGCLNRYETRKVCFAHGQHVSGRPEEGIDEALRFELLWLVNKHDHYHAISEEDRARIYSLRKRLGEP